MIHQKMSDLICEPDNIDMCRYQGKQDMLHILMGALVLMFFMTLVFSRNAASNFFYPVVFLAVYGVIRAPTRAKLERWEIAGLLVVGAWFLAAVLSHIYNGFPGDGNAVLQKRYAKLLYAVPIFLYFRQFPLSTRYIWLIGVLLSVLLGVVSVIEQWKDGLFMYPGRASGNIHPINFALIATSGACLTVAMSNYRSLRSRIITMVAVLLAMYAIVQSGSRGIWVAIPVLGYLLLWLKYGRAAIKPALIFTLVVIIAGIISYSHPYVKTRVDTAVSDVSSYLASIDVSDPARFTSVGGRLEMWRAASEMFSSSPWLGVGPDGFRKEALLLVDNGEFSAKLLQHMYPHNTYLTALTTTGLAGMLAMLAFFVGCLWLYGRAAFGGSVGEKQVATAGLMITALFMIGGLSDDNVVQKLPLTVFVFVQALLLGHLSYYRRHQAKSR